jgi:hypothetical protein
MIFKNKKITFSQENKRNKNKDNLVIHLNFNSEFKKK